MDILIEKAHGMKNALEQLSKERLVTSLTCYYFKLGFKDNNVLDYILENDDQGLIIYALELAFYNTRHYKINITDEMKNKLSVMNFDDIMKVYFTYMEEIYYHYMRIYAGPLEEEKHTNTTNSLLELLC